MWISRIAIARWRHFHDFELLLPRDARFVCVVGPNGSGKTALLELVTSAAYHFGLRPESSLARPAAGLTLEEDYEIEVTLDLSDEPELVASAHEQTSAYGGVVDLVAWDRTLNLSMTAAAGAAPARNVELGEHLSQGVDRHMLVSTALGGVGYQRLTGSAAVIDTLRRAPQILSLFIDSQRVFPQVQIHDAEVLQYAKQDTTLPEALRRQAAALTQNLYIDWIRGLLGSQQRRQTVYYQEAIDAFRRGEVPNAPKDPFVSYRAAIASILPHLEFIRLDQDERKLVFAVGGAELAFEDLSAGEREVAFLAGQLERFDVKDGLFLLDEPELHLNPDLLRRWLQFLRAAIGRGQAWIATHSLEAVEVAGAEDTIVLEPTRKHTVRQPVRLADRPVLQTLVGAIGAPGFSLSNSRFVLIEGTRGQSRERVRYERLLMASPGTRFIEAGNCREVLRRFEAILDLAWEAEQLHVGAIIDRDFRSDSQVEAIEAVGAHVLPVHELENFLLHPDGLKMLLMQAGRDPGQVLALLRASADPQAGRWIVEYASQVHEWPFVPSGVRGVAARLPWPAFAQDPQRAVGDLLGALGPGERELHNERKAQLLDGMNEYREARNDETRLWTVCRGKETLVGVAKQLGLVSSGALESRVVAAWSDSSLAQPVELDAVRRYVGGLPLRGVRPPGL